MKKQPPWFCYLIFIFSFLFLSTSFVHAQDVLDPSNGFAPELGKTLLIIGQDRDTIDEYVSATQIEPGGVMMYTSIQRLEGFWGPFNNGAGVHHAEYLMKTYPKSVLQVGLYLVGALTRINEGFYDANIDKLANWVSDLQRPVYLRIGYEFDNDLNHYDPLQYRYAFRRIVDRFRALGVRNVAFVWHSGGFDTRINIMNWHPGDEYIDWYAISFFSPLQHQKLREMALLAEEYQKPFMIAESTPAGTVSVRAKLDWYDKYFRLIRDTQPQAVSYINTHWDTQNMWKGEGYGDARIEKHPEIKEMWLKEIQKEKYIHAKHLN